MNFIKFQDSKNVLYPPASKASKEVANLTKRKNPHSSVYGVKEFVCLSVTKFDINYLKTSNTELSNLFSMFASKNGEMGLITAAHRRSP